MTDNIPIEGSAAHGRLIVFLATIVFFSVLNTTMFNVSLPDIAEQFRLLPSRVSWVVSGYVIIFAISSATYGRLADTYSIKTLVTIGLVLFNAPDPSWVSCHSGIPF